MKWKEKLRQIGKDMGTMALAAIIALALFGIVAAAESVHNINTGENYSTIQAAINNATVGDEIHVDSGTYYENVNVNKQLILKGVDTGAGRPVVDANGSGSPIMISTDGIILEGFTATKGGYAKAGIKVISNNNVLRYNNASSDNNGYGIHLYNSSNNILSGNIANFNIGNGIYLAYSSNNNMINSNNANSNTNAGIAMHESSNNTLISNNVSNNSYGIMLGFSSNNIITGNNLVKNRIYNAYDNRINQWDNGTIGNYYYDYIGTDSNNDGIGDTPYNISGSIAQDRYPLMLPYNGTFPRINHNPNPPTDLTQLKSDETTPISIGGTTNERTVVFKGRVSNPYGIQSRLEVELRGLDENNGQFNESLGGLKQSELVPNGSIATAAAVELNNKQYHWQVRTVDANGNKSAWQGYGGNLVSEADFSVKIPIFAQISDIHFIPSDRFGIEKFTDTLQAIKTHSPELALSTGDIADHSDPVFFQGYMGIMESLKSVNIPVYNIPGNHDSRNKWLTEIGLGNYNENVNNPASIIPLNDGLNGYYFDTFGFHFIGFYSGKDSSSIETSFTPESDGLTSSQFNRLNEADLKSGSKIIFMHHPVIDKDNDMKELGIDPVANTCSEYGGNNNAIIFNRCELIDYSIKNNVELVLGGHTHRDYSKYITNAETGHKTGFIQTRSATKDNEPYYHGYSTIEAAGGKATLVAHATDSTLSNADKEGYLFQDALHDVCYVKKDNKITGMNSDKIAVREIPDTYYTGDLTNNQETIVYYTKNNGEPDIFNCLKSEAIVGKAVSVMSEGNGSISNNITMRHRKENMAVEYVYENISLGVGINASLGINLSTGNENYTMEFDNDGDGTIDNIAEPTNIMINHAPKLVITTPVGIQSGNISIMYNLKDNESANVSILAQYSADNITWFDSTMGDGGSGMVNITSTPEGIDHTYVWLSNADIQNVGINGTFRIKAFEEEISSGYATTNTFSVLPALDSIRYINGTVIDSVTKTAIAGVSVSINGTNSTVTNSLGFYSLPVSEGEYNLKAKFEPTHYVNNSVTVSTVGVPVAAQDIELVEKPKGNIRGNVRN